MTVVRPAAQSVGAKAEADPSDRVVKTDGAQERETGQIFWSLHGFAPPGGALIAQKPGLLASGEVEIQNIVLLEDGALRPG